MSETLLEVRDLRVEYASRVVAVTGVSFAIARGETLAVAGRSGSGKSSLARALVRLVAATGSVRLSSRRWPSAIDVLAARGSELRAVRGAVQLVFQDAAASLDPRLALGEALGEALLAAEPTLGPGWRERARELLDLVALPRAFESRRPHELSGGEAQRAAIARALAVEPELLVCDEVLSALDASVQAQILELIARLVRERELACLFITHDLAAARWLCERIAVMHDGAIVESGETQAVLASPAHAHTRELAAASGL